MSRDVGEGIIDEIPRRRRWITNRKLDGWRVLEIAFALQISEIDRWWHIYRKNGWAGLHVKSHRPAWANADSQREHSNSG